MFEKNILIWIFFSSQILCNLECKSYYLDFTHELLKFEYVNGEKYF